MKTKFFAVGAFGIMASLALVPTAASAGEPLTVQPVKMLVTEVRGEITVPQTFDYAGVANPDALKGFTCANLLVTAQSKATKPKPAGYTGVWHDPPVWSHTVHTTGTYSSGKCSYQINVAGNDAFVLGSSIGNTTTPFQCTFVGVEITNNPGYMTVPKGTIKTVNLNVSHITCGFVA
jgi:hypothetical protein